MDAKKDTTLRNVLLVVGAISLMSVLIPVGVRAATSLVKIQDADSSTKVQVSGAGALKVGDGSGALSVDDANGALSVDDGSGSLTVDGELQLADTNQPPTQPYQNTLSPTCTSGLYDDAQFTVPANKMLVMQHIEFFADNAGIAQLSSTHDGRIARHLTPTLTGGTTASSNINTRVLDSEEPVGYADGGTEVTLKTQGQCGGDIGDLQVTVIGYLVND
jgi:hypothetical protein